jgi:hypothetical protein
MEFNNDFQCGVIKIKNEFFFGVFMQIGCFYLPLGLCPAIRLSRTVFEWPETFAIAISSPCICPVATAPAPTAALTPSPTRRDFANTKPVITITPYSTQGILSFWFKVVPILQFSQFGNSAFAQAYSVSCPSLKTQREDLDIANYRSTNDTDF